ncbi:hypothetical protein [Cecembia rubra]|uniref:SmpA/OmlA family protein n=1 Tax=Cecembia rubra TaxID=1485585 RepID=A0A2P8E0M3_9BACT|nr:hypothetical protein [Cecembia rubra]PSL03008.1 hypothetical protein CLV48_108117 [Cecembia rubra]
MGKLKLIIFIIVMGFILIFTNKQIIGLKNENNFSKLKIGMDKEEIFMIMGMPNSKYKGRSVGSDSIYFYQPAFASSSGLEVEFDSLGIVINLIGDH